MTSRQHIMAVVGALALLGATFSLGSGSSDDHVHTSSVTILPGPLTAILTWVSVDEQFQGSSVENQDGYFILHVVDERGYATGWHVSVSTLDYSGPDGHLGADQLVLVPGSVSVVRGNPNLTGHSTFSIEPMRTHPSRLWSVPNLSGDGEYDLPLGATLGTPDDHHRNYLYTVIVNIDGVAP